MRAQRPMAGFSLVELVVVVAILGIVMAMGYPSIRDLMANQRMKSAAFNLVVSTMYARGEAIKRGGTGLSVYIKAWKPDSGTYTNDLTRGWCVMLADADCKFPPTAQPTDPSTMRIQPPLDGVTYKFKPTSAAGSIRFNRAGRLDNQVRIEIFDNEDLATPRRCVTIDVGGNARSAMGACP